MNTTSEHCERSVSPPASSVDPDLRTLVGQLAHLIDRKLPPGDVASLRRLGPGLPDCAAFWKVVAWHLEPAGSLPAGGPARDDAERRWGTILQSMAMLRGLHRPGQRLGRILAEVRLSDLRFLKLLRSHGERLTEELRGVVHLLSSRAAAVDQADIARLVLSDNRSDGERVRRQLARDFFSQQARD